LPSLSNKVLTILTITFLSIAIIEFNQRQNLSSSNVWDSINQLSHQNIKAYSDRLSNELVTKHDTPVVIATTEVQLRGRLDERFLIWSLDGITDSHLKDFVKDGQIDHFAYINYREIKYLEDLPNYNLNKNKISLSKFNFSKENTSQCLFNIFLTKQQSTSLYEVNRC
jgi:hypothetical protein